MIFWNSFVNYFQPLVLWYLRPLVKWFLRKTTKLCELQRICYGDPQGAERTLNVETSLRLSRRPEIKSLIKMLDSVHKDVIYRRDFVHYSVYTVLTLKKIHPKVHPQFAPSFSRCIEQLHGYETLKRDVETLRVEQYNADNPEHEAKLIKLWEAIMPDTPLEARVTKQWQDIGFQGDDPKTDFRGMGMLGLENLLFFATDYNKAARQVLSHSHHPTYGYCFAIVGINLTSMAYHMLKDGSAKTHIFNISYSLPNMRLFHQLYCYLFYEFDRFWMEEKPRDIMEFNPIRDKFEKSIRHSLAKRDTLFKINLYIDNI
ncbi:ELMO domain-containing protein 1 [Cloeon dipterum]|uniref:ELMO domain-containing protein 1 n=1 Tax=Cloeon dipterum TaxID=197152 RepID=UPI0032207D38